MAEENLRQALEQAGIQPDELAEIVQVDIRSVRRWLSGIIPRPRQRTKIARALDTTEYRLWPQVATTPLPATQPSDTVTGYASADDLAAADWKALMRDATERIELLGVTLASILGTPGLPDLLAAKSEHGCLVRILLSKPTPLLGPFLHKDGLEVRVLQQSPQHAIYRFDDQLLLMLYLEAQDDPQAPMLHIRRAAPGALFDRLADGYDQLRAHARPLGPGVQLAEHDPEHATGAEPTRPTADQPAAARRQSPLASPRRWPRTPRK